MRYNLSDFNQYNGEEQVFIRAFMTAGSPKVEKNDNGIDVEFKLNGSDVNFKEFVKLFVQRYNHETKVEAVKILAANSNLNELNEFSEKILRLQRELDNMLAEKISSVLNLDRDTVNYILKNT